MEMKVPSGAGTTLCLGLLIKCMYSMEAPDIESMMALAQYVGIFMPLLA